IIRAGIRPPGPTTAWCSGHSTREPGPDVGSGLGPVRTAVTPRLVNGHVESTLPYGHLASAPECHDGPVSLLSSTNWLLVVGGGIVQSGLGVVEGDRHGPQSLVPAVEQVGVVDQFAFGPLHLLFQLADLGVRLPDGPLRLHRVEVRPMAAKSRWRVSR